MPPYAVLWDVDGTLVDTAELHFRAWCAMAGELGQPFTRDDFTRTFGWRNPEIIPLLFGSHLDADEISRIGLRKENLYRDEAQHGVELLPGVRPLLEGLRAAGFLQGIGSSAPRDNLEMILDLTGTREFFGTIVALEDTRRGKPDPEVFLRGAEKLGIAPKRCAVLEDAPAGIQAAKAAGMMGVGVTFVGHHSADKLRAAGADRVVVHLGEITPDEIRTLIDG